MAGGWKINGDELGDITLGTSVPIKAWRAEDRLMIDDLQALLEAYRGGATARALAERYELGATTVKRLREHGVRRGPDNR